LQQVMSFGMVDLDQFFRARNRRFRSSSKFTLICTSIAMLGAYINSLRHQHKRPHL
jgi:hypothetical protein